MLTRNCCKLHTTYGRLYCVHHSIVDSTNSFPIWPAATRVNYRFEREKESADSSFMQSVGHFQFGIRCEMRVAGHLSMQAKSMTTFFPLRTAVANNV